MTERCVLCDLDVEWDEARSCYVAVAPYSPHDRSSVCPDASGPYDPAHFVAPRRRA